MNSISFVAFVPFVAFRHSGTFLDVLSVTVALLLQAQTTPYLVLPKTRPELRSSVSSSTIVPRSSSSSNAPTASKQLQQLRASIIDLVNKERKKRRLPLLKDNALLTLSAQKHAEDMMRRKFFSHKNPEGKEPKDRIAAVGYFTKPCDCPVEFSYGENMAKDQKTPAEVMKAWMGSNVHRGNILKREFTSIGIGFSGGFWVQNFGGVAVGR